MDNLASKESVASFPHIYLGPLKEAQLEGFNAVVITLDARLDSSLRWTDQIKTAQKLISKGYHILWQLKFGLFKELHLPLSDTSQYRSLNLALDHFFDNVLQQFKENTLGVMIYQGSLDFSHDWSWDVDQVLNFRAWLSEHFVDHHAFTNLIGMPADNLLTLDPQDLKALENGKNLLRFYCMSAAMDYFTLLSTRFDANLLPYILLDCSSLHSPTHVFQLMDHEDCDYVQLAIKKSPFISAHALGWENKPYSNGFIGKEFKTYTKPLIEPQIGLVIPTKMLVSSKDLLEYDEAIIMLEKHQPIKLISERHITTEWQGIDVLVVFDLDSKSMRKLEGFIAAGGRVVVKNQLKLDGEIRYAEFLKSLEVL